jgi:hypothetical protein
VRPDTLYPVEVLCLQYPQLAIHGPEFSLMYCIALYSPANPSVELVFLSHLVRLTYGHIDCVLQPAPARDGPGGSEIE